MNSLRTSSSYNEATAGNFRFATEGDLGAGGIKGGIAGNGWLLSLVVEIYTREPGWGPRENTYISVTK